MHFEVNAFAFAHKTFVFFPNERKVSQGNAKDLPSQCLFRGSVLKTSTIHRKVDVFKLCRKDCIYELNAHECHHKVVYTSGKLRVSFDP